MATHGTHQMHNWHHWHHWHHWHRCHHWHENWHHWHHHGHQPSANNGWQQEPQRPSLADEKLVIREALGSGHSSTVYRATLAPLHEEVAAKLCRDPSALAHESKVLQRVAADTRAAERTIAYRGVEQTSHGPALLTRLERGGTLAAALARACPGGGAATPAGSLLLAAVIGEVADALDAIHALGVVHGDVKPDNVLLAVPASISITAVNSSATAAIEAPRLLLADLAEAKLADEPATFYSTPPGAHQYHCPADVAARSFSSASDSWALAQLAADVWRGAPPRANPAPLAEAMPLAAVLRRCHSASPSARPACAEVRDAADALLAARGTSRAQEMRRLMPLCDT